MSQFEQSCRFLQSAAGSFFTRDPGCSSATENGRITLAGMRLIETTAGDRTERVLKTEEERRAVLRERFGVLWSRPLPPARQS